MRLPIPERQRLNDMNNSNTRYVRNTTFAVGVLFQVNGKYRSSCYANGPVRLGQLARLIPAASKKMLTKNLRELEADGIVVRKDMSDLVLHIEYELNDSTREGVLPFSITSQRGRTSIWKVGK